MLGIIFAVLVYASSSETYVAPAPSATEVIINDIKSLSDEEKLVTLDKELAKNPDVVTGQPLLNYKINLIQEGKRIRSGSNKAKTIVYLNYVQKSTSGLEVITSTDTGGLGEGGFSVVELLLRIAAIGGLFLLLTKLSVPVWLSIISSIIFVIGGYLLLKWLIKIFKRSKL